MCHPHVARKDLGVWMVDQVGCTPHIMYAGTRNTASVCVCVCVRVGCLINVRRSEWQLTPGRLEFMFGLSCSS